MKKTKKDIRLLKKCIKKSEQSFDYFTLVVEKMILKHGVLDGHRVCLPVFIGNEAYRIYQYDIDKKLTYLTKNDEVREVNSLGRLLQAIQLILDSMEQGKY